MPSTFRDPTLLAAELQRMVANQNSYVITIDGWDYTGKSTLAKRLAEELNLCVIELDQFLNKNQGGYVQHIQYERLRNAFAHASHPRVLVEGICILKVLQRLRISPNIQVYMKKLSAEETWHPGLTLDPGKNAEQVIEEDKSLRKQIAVRRGNPGTEATGLEVLEYEIIRYHYTFKPHETADFYYEWLESAV